MGSTLRKGFKGIIKGNFITSNLGKFFKPYKRVVMLFFIRSKKNLTSILSHRERIEVRAKRIHHPFAMALGTYFRKLYFEVGQRFKIKRAE